MTTDAPLLAVQDLGVDFPTDDGTLHAVDGVTFQVRDHEVLGMVGESGSGKTVTALAMLGLLPKRAHVRGSVRLRGEELLGRPERELERLRGETVAIVFQDALAAFNPVLPVGAQVGEAIAVHHPDVGASHRRARVVELLELVGIPDAARRADAYPHQYSGGMRQRAMLAMALANDPALLIADEPTTALDVTVQAQILRLLAGLQAELGLAMLLITHDLGIVARVASRVSVMYAGEIVESAPAAELFRRPMHPYTHGLLSCVPVPGRIREDEQLGSIPGMVPTIVRGFRGCAFRSRCQHAAPECEGAIPRHGASSRHTYLCRLQPVAAASSSGEAGA